MTASRIRCSLAAAVGLVLAVVVLTGAVSAAETSRDSGRHWGRSSGAQTLVVVQVTPSAEVLRPAVVNAVARWNANPRISMVVRTCRSGENCLPVRGEARNGGLAPQAAIGERIVTSPNTYAVFDNRRGQNLAALANGICHELGHGLGLSHGSVDGPCVNAYPTRWDQDLLTRMYSHLDAAAPAGVR
jgi:hypothetical protein